jgi:phospholipid N-methyltransferase
MSANYPQPKKKSDTWMVFRKFLRHGSRVATFAPSSRFLVKAILNGIDFQRAKCIVELGAGTGPITEELVKRAGPDTKLMIVELDSDFCGRLREKFPRTEIVEGNAAHIDELMRARGITEVDHVISGLPLPSFKPEDRDAIITASLKVLKSGGQFRQLTNMPWVYKRLYKKYFETVKFRFVPMNFPPAGVYTCWGAKG